MSDGRRYSPLKPRILECGFLYTSSEHLYTSITIEVLPNSDGENRRTNNN